MVIMHAILIIICIMFSEGVTTAVGRNKVVITVLEPGFITITATLVLYYCGV